MRSHFIFICNLCDFYFAVHTNYTFRRSQQCLGKPVLQHRGFEYTINFISNETVTWRCCSYRKYKCLARAKIIRSTGELMITNAFHNHDPALQNYASDLPHFLKMKTLSEIWFEIYFISYIIPNYLKWFLFIDPNGTSCECFRYDWTIFFYHCIFVELINYVVSTTKRGRPMITHEGYTFILHNIGDPVYRQRYPMRHWHCNKSAAGCKVRVKMLEDKKLVFKTTSVHNHPPLFNQNGPFI